MRIEAHIMPVTGQMVLFLHLEDGTTWPMGTTAEVNEWFWEAYNG
jgi:hypothetical protein